MNFTKNKRKIPGMATMAYVTNTNFRARTVEMVDSKKFSKLIQNSLMELTSRVPLKLRREGSRHITKTFRVNKKTE